MKLYEVRLTMKIPYMSKQEISTKLGLKSNTVEVEEEIELYVKNEVLKHIKENGHHYDDIEHMFDYVEITDK